MTMWTYACAYLNYLGGGGRALWRPRLHVLSGNGTVVTLTEPDAPGCAETLAASGLWSRRTLSADPPSTRLLKWRTVSAATGTRGGQDAGEQVVPFDPLGARARDIHAGVPRTLDDHHEGLKQLGCARVCALQRRGGISAGVQHQNRRGRAPVPGAGVAVGVVALPERARDRAEDGDSAEIRL